MQETAARCSPGPRRNSESYVAAWTIMDVAKGRVRVTSGSAVLTTDWLIRLESIARAVARFISTPIGSSSLPLLPRLNALSSLLISHRTIRSDSEDESFKSEILYPRIKVVWNIWRGKPHARETRNNLIPFSIISFYKTFAYKCINNLYINATNYTILFEIFFTESFIFLKYFYVSLFDTFLYRNIKYIYIYITLFIRIRQSPVITPRYFTRT